MSQPRVRRSVSHFIEDTMFNIGRAGRKAWDTVAEIVGRVPEQLEVARSEIAAARAGEEGIDVAPTWETGEEAA